jgi:hypothetical protein
MTIATGNASIYKDLYPSSFYKNEISENKVLCKALVSVPLIGILFEHFFDRILAKKVSQAEKLRSIVAFPSTIAILQVKREHTLCAMGRNIGTIALLIVGVAAAIISPYIFVVGALVHIGFIYYNVRHLKLNNALQTIYNARLKELTS